MCCKRWADIPLLEDFRSAETENLQLLAEYDVPISIFPYNNICYKISAIAFVDKYYARWNMLGQLYFGSQVSIHLFESRISYDFNPEIGITLPEFQL